MKIREQAIHLNLNSEQEGIWRLIRATVYNSREDELYTKAAEEVFMQIQALIIQELAKKGILSCENEAECFAKYSNSGLSQKFRDKWGSLSGKDEPMTKSTIGQYTVYLISIGEEDKALNFLVESLDTE